MPGTAEAAAALREAGVKLAVTTGYDTAMMKLVLDAAVRQGFVPDAAVCASDVAAAAERMTAAGADAVIESVAELPALVRRLGS